MAMCVYMRTYSLTSLHMIPSTKKIAISLLAATLLLASGCSIGGGGTDNNPTGVEESVLQTYSAEDYQITVPKAWNVIQKNEFTSDVPQNAVIAFQANRKNEIFLANVNITRNTLSQNLEPLDYGKIVVANQKNTLQNFVEKSREEFDTTIKGNKKKVLMAKFEGKRTTTDPLITFVQAYYLYDRTAYIVTGAYASSEDPDVQKETDNIVRSFSIK